MTNDEKNHEHKESEKCSLWLVGALLMNGYALGGRGEVARKEEDRGTP